MIIWAAGRCGSDVVAVGSVDERKVENMGLPTEDDAALVLFVALRGGSQ